MAMPQRDDLIEEIKRLDAASNIDESITTPWPSLRRRLSAKEAEEFAAAEYYERLYEDEDSNFNDYK